MDSSAAEEVSRDPRILSGYPVAELEGLDLGAVHAVGVGEPQVQGVVLQLLQPVAEPRSAA